MNTDKKSPEEIKQWLEDNINRLTSCQPFQAPRLAEFIMENYPKNFTISRDKAVEKVQEVLLEWKDTDLPETMKARYVIDSLIYYNIEGCKDSEMLDWLQNMMTKGDNYCEIFFAGLRGVKDGQFTDATAFQVESNPHKFDTFSAPTLREAILKAMNQVLPPIPNK